ncbi:hypothetical protein YC2023_115973 [Brassica napus]
MSESKRNKIQHCLLKRNVAVHERIHTPNFQMKPKTWFHVHVVNYKFKRSGMLSNSLQTIAAHLMIQQEVLMSIQIGQKNLKMFSYLCRLSKLNSHLPTFYRPSTTYAPFKASSICIFKVRSSA